MLDELTADDFDAACMRIQAASHMVATGYPLPESARGLLRAIAADAGFLFQFGRDANQLVNGEGSTK